MAEDKKMKKEKKKKKKKEKKKDGKKRRRTSSSSSDELKKKKKMKKKRPTTTDGTLAARSSRTHRRENCRRILRVKSVEHCPFLTLMRLSCLMMVWQRVPSAAAQSDMGREDSESNCFWLEYYNISRHHNI